MMSGREREGRESWFRFIFSQAPAWIIALIAVFGFIAGYGTRYAQAPARHGKASTAAPQPTVTVTKTVPVGGQASPLASGGTQLASYPVNLPPGYAVPLGVTPPTQSQFIHVGGFGDLVLNTSGLVGPGSNLLPLSGDKMILLKSGSTPTYKTCSTGTGFVSSVDNTTGAAFCLIEGTGKLAGISVSSIGSAQPYDSVLQVTVWQGAS
jgi:hypothetical protein